ncbi:PTS lactose/cellobiose transporter subunit IIA [Thermoanaerobacterium sp. DL9XJH110]|uniref:PTS lactose/cellobiose transporter subunit IIA n=1 Tax=Thermoanaerobacterium sp. DL9XJH110 TaxID=3386643 RepID=UPI003BB5A969
MDLEQIAFQIIANSGEARSKISEAMDACEDGQLDRAEKLIEEAEKSLLVAHDIHMKVCQKEASGESIQPTLLLIHGMDLMLVTESERDMAKRMVRIAKKLIANREVF